MWVCVCVGSATTFTRTFVFGLKIECRYADRAMASFLFSSVHSFSRPPSLESYELGNQRGSEPSSNTLYIYIYYRIFSILCSVVGTNFSKQIKKNKKTKYCKKRELSAYPQCLVSTAFITPFRCLSVRCCCLFCRHMYFVCVLLCCYLGCNIIRLGFSFEVLVVLC